MFKSKTVFILGSGSSNEVGLPVAGELATEIAKRLDIRFEAGFQQISGDPWIMEAYRRKDLSHANDYRSAGCSIASGILLANSIDNFLDNHRDNLKIKLCGKLGIVRAILEAEERSSLFVDLSRPNESISLAQVASTWFVKFFRMLSEQVSKAELERLFDNVAFINFNYDRCLEQFLFYAVRAKYGLDWEDARSVMERCIVYHPYGSIGCLTWQSGGQLTPFGSDERHPDNLLLMADSIRTFTEEVAEASQLTVIRNLISESRNLVFLGFAFHAQNLELLRPDTVVTPKRIYGTALGISMSDRSVISDALAAIFGAPKVLLIQSMDLHEGMCSSLFDAYSRSLAQA